MLFRSHDPRQGASHRRQSQADLLRLLNSVDSYVFQYAACLRLTTIARPLPRIVDEYTKIESRRQRSLAGSSQRHELQAGRATLGAAQDFGSRLLYDSHRDRKLTLGNFVEVAEAEENEDIEAGLCRRSSG